uniref:Uncharacterized protein n=1 Tax=Strigamia maritima TaxID=126957 RepID=T1J3D7_STRMM
MNDVEEDRKMWANYWDVRNDYILKVKDQFPESEFFQRSHSSDFCPSYLNESSSSNKHQHTGNSEKMSEEYSGNKFRKNWQNEENDAMFQSNSTVEVAMGENTMDLIEQNDVEIQEDKINDDLVITSDNQNKEFPEIRPESEKSKHALSFGKLQSVMRKFIRNYSSLKCGNKLTFDEKVATALSKCDFNSEWRYYVMEGTNANPKITCELYFEHFVVATGRAPDQTKAQALALEHFNKTLQNGKRGNKWYLLQPTQLINIEDAQPANVEKFLSELIQIEETIKQTQSNIENSKIFLNDTFKKFRQSILWKWYFGRGQDKNQLFCEIIFMTKFRLSYGKGQSEEEAACNASDIFLGKLDVLMKDLRSRKSVL